MSVKLNTHLLEPLQQRSLVPAARVHQALEPNGIEATDKRVVRVAKQDNQDSDTDNDEDCDETDDGDCEDETVTELN